MTVARFGMLLSAACGAFVLAAADAEFDEYFSDNMVLQRNVKCPISGVGVPGVEVGVSLVEVSLGPSGVKISEMPPYTTRVNEEGVWRLELNPNTAGGPHAILLRADGEAVGKCENVMFGEVFLFVSDGEKGDGVQAVKLPQLRLRVAGEGWRAAVLRPASDFPAAAFDFGLAIQSALEAPVGVIQVASLDGATVPTALRAMVYSPAVGTEWSESIAEEIRKWRSANGNEELPVIFDGSAEDFGMEAVYGVTAGSCLAHAVLERVSSINGAAME